MLDSGTTPITPRSVYYQPWLTLTGAFDMAERYENTKILGLDLTPPPQSLFNNLEFQVDDIRAEWIPNDGYDLVHIRLLFGAIEDWPGLYAKAFEYVVLL